MDINDTRNTLLYSLLMDVPSDISLVNFGSPSIEDVRSWLNDAFEKTSSVCKKFNNVGSFYFVRWDNKDGIQHDYSSMLRLPEFWSHIYKQEAILSAYDTIRRLLASKQSLSITDFSKITLPHGELVDKDKNTEHFGLYYLLTGHDDNPPIATLSKGLKIQLSLPNNLCVTKEAGLDPRKKENLKPVLCNKLLNLQLDESEAECGIRDQETANDLLDKLLSSSDIGYLKDSLLEYYEKLDSNDVNYKAKRLYTTLSKVSNPAQLSFNSTMVLDEGILTQLNTLEFYQYTNAHDSSFSKKRSSINSLISPQIMGCTKFGQREYNALVEDYKELTKDLQLPGLYNETYNLDKVSTDCKLELADKVYLRYTLEKTLSVELIDCICSCVSQNKHSEYLKEQVSLLSQLCLLPNAFSRPLIVQGILDNIGYKHLRVNDYADQPQNSFGSVDREALNYSEYENLILWQQNFADLVNVLRNYIFPVQNSFFFITLWDSLYREVKSENKCIEMLFMILSAYLNSEKEVYELLSFDKLIDSINSAYLDTYEKGAINFPFQCSIVERENGKRAYIPSGFKKSMLKKSEANDYFSFYLRLGQAISATSKNRPTCNTLISKDYIDKLYIPVKTNVHQLLFRAAKQRF